MSTEVSVKVFPQFINGNWIHSSSGELMDVINPANGEVAARVMKGNAQDVDIAVGALRDPSARAVEDRLVAPGFRRLLRCHHGGDQVQRLDIAVQEAGILHRDQGDGLRLVDQLLGRQRHPQIGLALGEGVAPGARAAASAS